MACEVTLNTINFDACSIATGGLKKLYLYNRISVESPQVMVNSSLGIFTCPTNLTASGVTLDFNTKDGFSNFTDVKTVNANGSFEVVPTIQVEFATMDAATRTALEYLATPGAELVAFVETAAGTRHMVGWEFGLYASSIDGASGASRGDKNRFQLTLTGSENHLSYHPALNTDWTNIIP
jgi:hypothetical protein